MRFNGFGQFWCAVVVAALSVGAVAYSANTATKRAPRTDVVHHAPKQMPANLAWGESPNTCFCHICPDDCPTGDWYYCSPQPNCRAGSRDGVKPKGKPLATCPTCGPILKK